MTQEKELRGVGGWLSLLVAGLLVFGPVFSIGSTVGAFGLALDQNPDLAWSDDWARFKSAIWVAILAMSALSCYAGWGLAQGSDWAVVRRAKVILWLAPVWSVVLNIIIPAATLGQPMAGGEIVGGLVKSIVAASIWTAYLSKSKRVRNTYGGEEHGAGASGIESFQAHPTTAISSARTAPKPASEPPMAEGSNVTLAPIVRLQIDEEDTLYDRIGAEIESGNKDRATWTRSLADADGEEQKAQALYIKRRFDKLSAEIIERKNSERAQEAKLQQERASHAATMRNKVVRGELKQEVYRLANTGEEYRFFAACERGGVWEVRELLEKSPALVACRQPDGSTGLHLAAQKGRPELVKLLLDSGSDPSAADHTGRRPLEVAELGSQIVDQLLIDAGATKSKAKCPSCSRLIDRDAPECPHCGAMFSADAHWRPIPVE